MFSNLHYTQSASQLIYPASKKTNHVWSAYFFKSTTIHPFPRECIVLVSDFTVTGVVREFHSIPSGVFFYK